MVVDGARMVGTVNGPAIGLKNFRAGSVPRSGFVSLALALNSGTCYRVLSILFDFSFSTRQYYHILQLLRTVRVIVNLSVSFHIFSALSA